MKRICFVVDSIFSIGSVQRVTAVIAKELAKDYDVTIATFDKREQADRSLYHLDEAKLDYLFLTYPQIGKLKKYICKAFSGLYVKLQPRAEWCSNLYARSSFPYELRQALLPALQYGDFEVVIGVHAPLAARLATLKKELPNIKCIGWLHNSYEALFGETSRYIGAERRRHYIHQFKKLDDVVVLCKDDANRFSTFDDTFKPTVIYNPLTLLRGNLATGTSKHFLTIGRFTPKHKGIDLLIEAFQLFAQKNKEWHLDIVGEGTEETSFKKQIAHYHLEDRITIHPFTNHIQDYYSNTQVYVLSSRWEGMPLVLVEAMAHGLPIVSSDLPVSKEIMGDFGLYFKNGDVNDLAQKLEDATHMDWEANSKEALEIAKRFDIKHIIGQWKKLIE